MLNNNSKIGICLSGGGVRAIAFHAGVFKFIIEKNLLKNIVTISTVSGGTLFTGFFMKETNFKFDDTKLAKNALERIRNIITTNSLQCGMIRYILTSFSFWERVTGLEYLLRKKYLINENFDALPKKPVWSINGTTGNTGVRFRIKNNNMGDYQIGYADTSTFPLAKAMAFSAAFPGLIGPMTISTTQYEFKLPENNSYNIDIPQLEKKYSIYDGGLYDNLGMEPLFDIGKKCIKEKEEQIDFIIASDAGSPLVNNIPPSYSPYRLKRLFDIAQGQNRALRVRPFVDYILSTKKGLYLNITEDIQNKRKNYKITEDIFSQYKWLTSSDVSQVKWTKTSLARLSNKTYNLIEKHGYESALSSYLINMKI